jgi:hypothetical protein
LSTAAEARAAELLNEAKRRPLKPAEAEELSKLLSTAAHARVAADPWLEWTGKRERKDFEVDPVALHIHERVSTQAIVKVAARQDVQRFLFADPEQEYHEAVQFYRHDVDWANGAGQTRKLAVQIKGSFTVSRNDVECVKTFADFWRDFRGSSRFERGVDAFAVIMQRGTQRLLKHLNAVLDCARASIDAPDLIRRLRPSGYLHAIARGYASESRMRPWTLSSRLCRGRSGRWSSFNG